MTLAVSTGLDSFLNPSEIGPMYPFVGAEWVFVVLGFVGWLAWHVIQGRQETEEENEGCELYDKIGLDRAMYHGGSAIIATDEEWTGLRPSGGTGPPPAPGTTSQPPPGT